MKSNIEVISDLLSEQIGCTQKERMEQYSKWNIYWNHIAKHQNANESNGITKYHFCVKCTRRTVKRV